MNLLIVGGTRFLGKALVEASQAIGHNVTLFNRGQSHPDWFLNIEQLHGDRNRDLSILKGRQWDAVIDTCAYFPRQVRELLEAIGGSIGHYTLISTISVYADFSQPGMDETAPVATIDDPTIEEITGGSYGPLKALCEQAALDSLGEQVLIVRPGLIVGPFDPTDRFTYWPARISRGGDLLVPDSPDWETQIIDVRDLAKWTIWMVEKRANGIFNATGPDQTLTFGEILDATQMVSGASVKFHWVDTQFLLDHSVEPWSDLPLWLPGSEYAGMDRINIQKAINHGLEFRPLKATISDTLDWEKNRPPDHDWKAGLKSDREAELLSKWQSLQNG